MLLGLQIPDFTWPGAPASIGPTFRRIAKDADHAGLASLWVMDHFFQLSMLGQPENEMLEGWLALAHAAAVTENITLGTMVTGVTYRHPGLLIKAATTLDVLSGGRAWLGIGAAWNEEEHLGLGVPFPSTSERFERLEETLRLAHQMWSGDETPFHGRHYTLQRPLNSPPAISQPHPRILVGGMGEKKTLRFVAQYADACNIFDVGRDGVLAKLDVLDRHCADVGRDPGQIERTVLSSFPMGDGSDTRPGPRSVEQAVDLWGPYAEIGVDHVIVNSVPVLDPASFDALAQLREKLAAITPAGR
jgi:F420-dependent oxidoreductase-like protein